MEIVDYLRIARRRLLVLVGVPVLAAALALAYLMAHPRPYVATVYVAAPSLMGSQDGTYQGPGDANQFPSDFVATATSPAVVNAVARQTHVGVSDIEQGLSVQQVDISSRMQISYTTRDPSTAGPVAVAVARQTLTRLFAPQVHTARVAVRSATASLHAANAALADFTKAHLGILGNRQDTALVTEHADLLAMQAAAAATLTNSQQVFAEAQVQLAAALPRQLQAPPTVQVSMAHLVVTTVLPAAAVGLFLAIVLVALLELITQRRPRTVGERLLARTYPAAGNGYDVDTAPEELETVE